MHGMFDKCSSFNQSLNFNTIKVENIGSMFRHCGNLLKLMFIDVPRIKFYNDYIYDTKLSFMLSKYNLCSIINIPHNHPAKTEFRQKNYCDFLKSIGVLEKNVKPFKMNKRIENVFFINEINLYIKDFI